MEAPVFIVGHKVKTVPVPNGREKTMSCQTCGTARLHREHRARHAATVFFMPVANVTDQTVWCCDGCGVRVSEGFRLPGAQEGTAAGQMLATLGTLAEQAAPALQQAHKTLAEQATPVLAQARELLDDAVRNASEVMRSTEPDGRPPTADQTPPPKDEQDAPSEPAKDVRPRRRTL